MKLLKMFEMKDDQNLIEIKDFQKGYLTIPFDEGQFKEFVTGLLGKPQSITKRLQGTFEIHLKDLQNFHDLIEQRIIQQNNGKLIQLKTRIYYDDESSVLLSSLDELVTYNEVKPVISVAVRMSWSYLIKFSDKTVPEKQEIEIMFVADQDRSILEENDLRYHFIYAGEVRLSIQHTARSWGSDIESLITNQFKSILITKNKWLKFIQIHSLKIGVLTGVVFMISSMAGVYFATKNFNAMQIKAVENYSKSSSENLAQKMDYLLNYIAKNEQAVFGNIATFYFFIALFLSILLAAWVSSLANNEEKSYIILTREALRNRDKSEKRRQKKGLLFIASIVIAIITKVISGVILDIMYK